MCNSEKQGTPSYTRKQSEGAMEHFRYEVSFENITTQVALNFKSNFLRKYIFAGRRVHSDDFDRVEWTDSDTNSGEVSNGPTKPIVSFQWFNHWSNQTHVTCDFVSFFWANPAHCEFPTCQPLGRPLGKPNTL